MSEAIRNKAQAYINECDRLVVRCPICGYEKIGHQLLREKHNGTFYNVECCLFIHNDDGDHVIFDDLSSVSVDREKNLNPNGKFMRIKMLTTPMELLALRFARKESKE